MPVALDDVVAMLKSDPIADPSGLLKPAGKRELLAAIERASAGGQRAYVVLAPDGTALGGWHALWDRLALDGRRDLLLLFNGQRWEARGWGLSQAAIDRALAGAEAGVRRYYARGLADALAGLAVAAHPGKASGPAGSAPNSGQGGGIGAWLGGGAAAAGLGLLGLVIARRRKLASERARSLTAARSAAEEVFAEVILASEDLPEADAAVLRDRATSLRGQLDAVAPPSQKALPAKEGPLVLAKITQLENELEALRSVVLQKKRRA